MHLQQTKVESRTSGGPQYYFHDVPQVVKGFLRSHGACPVILETPYGITSTSFIAVGRDHKLTPDGRPVAGRVGHDRIQQGNAQGSVGEAIRHWFGIRGSGDFERIEVDVRIHSAGHFILSPLAATLRNKARPITLPRHLRPLSFHRDLQSRLWRDQFDFVRDEQPDQLRWAARQIGRLVQEHLNEAALNVSEADLLRVAGAFDLLGLRLGPYLLGGYDCQGSSFEFRGLPEYSCPVEIKKRSRGFRYQMARYAPLPRAVILCLVHDLRHLPEDIDIIELAALAEHLLPD